MVRAPSWIAIVWIVAGVAVAAVNDYFDNLETAGRILGAVLAVLFWPIVLIGFDIRVSR